MAKRYFNWKLAIVLLMGFVVLGATAVGLRRWQRSRRAENALPRGLDAYKQQRWEEAASNLGRYLGVNRGDVNVLLKYAEAQLNIRPPKPNRVQQAIAAYREVLRIDRSNTEAARRLTEIYLAILSPGEAELIARRQLEIGKDPELRRLLAVALAAQRKFDDAATELKSIIAEHPDQILAYETLGRLAQQRPEDFPDPADSFNQAVDKNPSSALAHIIRAGFLLQTGKAAEAIADLEQAEKLDVTDPDVRLRLATEYINAGILDKAETHLAAVQAVKPKDATLWQTWARLALKSQSEAKMTEVAETGLRELSSYPWDFLPMAAELFMRGGQLSRAKDCIAKMREKDLLPETVVFFEGLIAEQKGDIYEAVRCWQRSIELGNKFPQVRLALASALSRLGDTQSALRELRRLVSDMPDFAAGRMALVRLLARAGNWPAVVEEARRATQLAPQNLEAALYYLRAQTYSLAAQPAAQNARIWKDIENRLAALEKATEGAVDVKLLQFQLAMQQKNLSGAQDLLTQLKKEPATMPSIALAEAELLSAQEKTNEAISILKQAVKESPDALEPVNYLAILLNRQNNREECEAVIKDALARIEQPATQRELGLLLAQLHTQWQKQDKAYELLKTLTEKLPGDIPLKRRLLACEQVISDPAKAQQIVDNIKTLEEGQAGWQWRYEQARIWLTRADFRQRYTQITSLLQENLLANPEDQASRTLLAGAYDRAGEQRLAISTYREALSRSPNDLRIIIPFVAALYRAGEDDQADQILQRASEQELYHPQLDVLRFERHLRLGELSAASDALENLLASDPNNRGICLTLAGLKMQQNQLDEAEQLLDRLIIQEPNLPAVASLRVKLRILQGKPEEAIRICDEIVNSVKNASAYVLRARAYSDLGDPDKAEKDLEHAGRIEPNNLEVWTAKSDFYGSRGQPDKAVDCLLQALSIEPNNLPVQKRAIAILLASGSRDRIQQGKTILDKALQASPADIDLRLFKANSLLAEGTVSAVAGAQEILQKITKEHPEVSSAWALLSQIAMSQQDPAKALDAAMRGLVHKPNDKALLLAKANAEVARSPILAISTLRTLHDLDPNDVNIALRLGTTYVAAGQPKNAVRLLEEQLTLCKDSVQQRRVNTAIAFALYKNGNKEDAQKKFDSLLQSAPDDPYPLVAQAQLLADDKLWSDLDHKVTRWCQDNPKDTNTPIAIAGRLAAAENDDARKVAEDLLRVVLQRDRSNLAAMTMLAMLLQTLGRQTESAELYRQILELNPDNVIVINNLAWIMCEEQKKFQEALALVQKGLAIAPQYMDLIDTRGVVYYRLGQLEKAIADFTECLKLYLDTAPAKAAAHFHLARALTKLGQTAKAIEQLNRALDLHDQTKGLSAADLTEVQRLQQELQKGS